MQFILHLAMISKLIKNILSVGKKATKEEPQKATKAALVKDVSKKSVSETKVVVLPDKAAAKLTVKKTETKKSATIEVKNTSAVSNKTTEAKVITKKSVEKTTPVKKAELTDNSKKPEKKTKEIILKTLEPLVKKEEPSKKSESMAKTENKQATNEPVAKKSKKEKEVIVTPVRQATPAADGKRKIIVDYKNVPDEVLKALSDKYPHGYNKGVIKFTNAKKELVSAVPIELDNTTYLVKISSQLQKMVNDFDDDDIFTDVVVPAEKEIPVGAGGDFDDFDKSDDDDSPKKKSKGKVKSADDLEYGFSDDDDDDDVDDDDDDDDVSGDDIDDDDE